MADVYGWKGFYDNDYVSTTYKSEWMNTTTTDNWDTIHTYEGNDTIYAGGGADDLYGGTGVDQLYGEAGADWFYFDKADTGDIYDNQADTIWDFNGYEGDMIKLTGGISDYSVWQKDSDWVVTWYDTSFHDILVKDTDPTGYIDIV